MSGPDQLSAADSEELVQYERDGRAEDEIDDEIYLGAVAERPGSPLDPPLRGLPRSPDPNPDTDETQSDDRVLDPVEYRSDEHPVYSLR